MNKLFTLMVILAATACNSSTSGQEEQPADLKNPIRLSAETAGPNASIIYWTSVSTGFEYSAIERKAEGSDFVQIATVPQGESSYIDKTLNAEGTYFYRIKDVKGTQESPWSRELEYAHKAIIPAPTSLKINGEDKKVTLTWKDNCIGEEGYVVSWKRGSEASVKQDFLKPDAETWTYSLDAGGDYTFEVAAFKGTLRSDAATVSYSLKGGPAISYSGAEASWWAAKAEIKVEDDGGEACEVGICWGESANPTADKDSYTAGKIKTGATITALAEYLEAGKTYHFRAWARNSNGTSYSDDFTLTLKANPSELKPEWTDISSQYGMGDGVKLYKTVTSVTGKSVNIWYASFKSGNATLNTVMAGSLTAPTDMVKNTLASRGKAYVTINGGYFSTSSSYSFVKDNGSVKANNIASLSRTNTYPVTRGAFGVDASGKPSVKWIYHNNSTIWAYDKALPVVDGNPVLTPSQSSTWNIHSGIGGAPVLLKDGVMCFDYMKTSGGKYATNHELLQTDIFADGLRAPRTAIGHTSDGTIILLVCDGRNAGGSAGLTLDELARIMKGLGCTDALNLDGGGSSQICVSNDGTLLNNPSDGTQRKVLSFVSIIGK